MMPAADTDTNGMVASKSVWAYCLISCLYLHVAQVPESAGINAFYPVSAIDLRETSDSLCL